MKHYSNLTYKGTLYIEANGKKYVSDNTGSINLFRLIASVLCGEYTTSRGVPTYIMLYNTDVETLINNPIVTENKSAELLNRFIDVMSYSSEESGNVDSNFVSTIYSPMLLTTAVMPANVTAALIAADKTQILAAVNFKKDVYDVIRSGSQAQLKWVLNISNKQEEKEN